MYSLLYYPDFRPDPLWLRKVLLLADDVTRIVPRDVELDDSQGLLALQDSIPGCLRRISPEETDVAIEMRSPLRLEKAFEFLAHSCTRKSKKNIEIVISADGSVSIRGHVFLHTSKMSPSIYELLHRHGLVIPSLGSLYGQGEFAVVNEAASDLILSAIAENISRRTAMDAITDKPIPFALNSLNNLGIERVSGAQRAEGTLFASLTSILIPSGLSRLNPAEYRSLRESFAPIRCAFKELTADLANVNRLNRIDDPKRLSDKTEAVAQEFFKEYRAFRKSRYTRRFKSWVPLSVGGLLATAATAVSPPVAAGLAGASLVFQLIQRSIDDSAVRGKNEGIFNMIAGMRKNIIHRSGIKQII